MWRKKACALWLGSGMAPDVSSEYSTTLSVSTEFDNMAYMAKDVSFQYALIVIPRVVNMQKKIIKNYAK